MIAVDLGCAAHEGERSVETLIARYKPQVLFGFDPSVHTETKTIDGVPCFFRDQAAWIHDGGVELANGAHNRLYDSIERDYDQCEVWQSSRPVRCFDFADWLLSLVGPAVVKMNIEGAEIRLMEHILDREADGGVVEWLIAWHDEFMPPEYAERRRAIEARVTAPLRSWGPADIYAAA